MKIKAYCWQKDVWLSLNGFSSIKSAAKANPNLINFEEEK